MPLEATIKYDQVQRLATRLEVAGRDVQREIKQLHTRIASKVKDTASLYAPKSPTDAERRSVSRATRKQWAAARKRRTSGATSRRKPGALQSSIDFIATAQIAEVFVPTNSPAGAYAYKIHEEKGLSWLNRGIGTRKKGSKADAKFISRAIRDSDGEIVKLIEATAQKMAGKL